MATDETEELLPLAAAAKHIPGRPHRATIWRWAQTGIVRNGHTIRLATVICGRRRYTTRAAVAAFIEACSRDTGVMTTAATRSNDRIAADLTARGI